MTVYVSETDPERSMERPPEVDVIQPVDAWARKTHEVLRQRFGEKIPRLPGSVLIQIDRETHEARPPSIE